MTHSTHSRRRLGAVAVMACGWMLAIAAPAAAQDPVAGDEKKAVECAIHEIESMAAGDADNRERLKAIAKCLSEALAAGQIRSGGVQEADAGADTTKDNKESWGKGDRINVRAEYLKKAEPTFSILVGLLVHEAIHAMQLRADAYTPDPGGMPDPEHWNAYAWGKFALEKRLKTPGLTDAEKKEIKRWLEFWCDFDDRFCEPKKQTERQQKGRHAGGGTRADYPSSSSDSIQYAVSHDGLGLIDVWDRKISDVVRTLASSHEVVTALAAYPDGKGGDVLYVFGCDASYLSGGLETFGDVDADGLIDQASRAWLLPPGSFGLPQSIAADDHAGALYVLNLDEGDVTEIRVLRDQDGDGRPEILIPHAFASEIDHPALETAESIARREAGFVHATPLPSGGTGYEPILPWFIFRDADGDDRAEQAVTTTDIARRSPQMPVIANVAQAGDEWLHVNAAPGGMIEIWRTDEDGNPVEFLGGAACEDPDWLCAIELERPLIEGTFVSAFDVARGLEQYAPTQVAAIGPEITNIDSEETFVLPGMVVTLEGRHFTPGAEVVLLDTQADVIIALEDRIDFIAPFVHQTPTGQTLVQVVTAEGISNAFGLLVDGDCNRNGVPDRVDIADGLVEDCDMNNVADACDPDRDGDGIPDACDGPWHEDFDRYAEGPLPPQSDWEPWNGDENVANFLVTSAQSRSRPHSVAIDGPDDAVRRFDVTDGRWAFSTWVYVPADMTREQWFILLSRYPTQYPDGWSLAVDLDGRTGREVVRDLGTGSTLPLIRDAWVEIRVEIDLDEDAQSVFYGGEHLVTKGWSDGVGGEGETTIAAVDLWGAQSGRTIYYDDFSLESIDHPACPADVDGDGVVGFDDVLAVLAAWDPYDPCPPYRDEDVDRDCAVGFSDLLAVLATWGPCG